jgi:hypothetical protein
VFPKSDELEIAETTAQSFKFCLCCNISWIRFLPSVGGYSMPDVNNEPLLKKGLKILQKIGIYDLSVSVRANTQLTN